MEGREEAEDRGGAANGPPPPGFCWAPQGNVQQKDQEERQVGGHHEKTAWTDGWQRRKEVRGNPEAWLARAAQLVGAPSWAPFRSPQGTPPGCGFDPRLAHLRKATDPGFSLSPFLSAFFLLPLSLCLSLSPFL